MVAGLSNVQSRSRHLRHLKQRQRSLWPVQDHPNACERGDSILCLPPSQMANIELRLRRKEYRFYQEHHVLASRSGLLASFLSLFDL